MSGNGTRPRVLVFSSGNGNAISAAPGNSGNALTVELKVGAGTILVTPAGATSVAGNGGSDVVITGLATDVNATLASVNNLAPPTVLAQASRLNFSTRLFNLLVTNVPGPQLPLYVLGRQLLDVFPIAFLPRNHALAIAIMSYNGAINFGLLGDLDALPDIDVIAEGITAHLAELVSLAKAGERVEV